jgi:hypothetical protein
MSQTVTAIRARVVVTGAESGDTNRDTTLGIYDNLPEISWTYKRSDVGSATWTIPLSHHALTRDQFGPRRNDFRIGVSTTGGVGTWRTVFSGILGPVGLSSTNDSISCSGVDWTAWLEQPYKFTGYAKDVEDWTEDDLIKWWLSPADTQQDMIADLIDSTWNGDALESCHITPTFNGTGWTTAIYITTVKIGDESTVLSTIKNLGAMNEPWGFEFFMYHNKELMMEAPRRVPIVDAVSASMIDFKPSNGNLISVDGWTNNGPDAITVIGKPDAFPAWKGYSTYAASRTTYRDWWKIKAIGNIHRDQHQIDSITDAYGTQLRNPQKDLTIVVKPDETGVDDADTTWFFDNWCGYVIHVDSEDWFLPYHRIQAYYWITAMEFKHDDSGNWTCTLTLEQIY